MNVISNQNYIYGISGGNFFNVNTSAKHPSFSVLLILKEYQASHISHGRWRGKLLSLLHSAFDSGFLFL